MERCLGAGRGQQGTASASGLARYMLSSNQYVLLYHIVYTAWGCVPSADDSMPLCEADMARLPLAVRKVVGDAPKSHDRLIGGNQFMPRAKVWVGGTDVFK